MIMSDEQFNTLEKKLLAWEARHNKQVDLQALMLGARFYKEILAEEKENKRLCRAANTF